MLALRHRRQYTDVEPAVSGAFCGDRGTLTWTFFAVLTFLFSTLDAGHFYHISTAADAAADPVINGSVDVVI